MMRRAPVGNVRLEARSPLRRRHVALALTPAAWLAACSGMLHGAPSAPETPSPHAATLETRVVPEPNMPPPEGQTPIPAPVTTPSAAPPSADALDKQFEILAAAVNALHQEVDRNDARSQDLLQENKRLRVQADSLLRDLTKSRGSYQRLKNQVQALEKELHEIGETPPEAAGEPREGRGESAEAVARTRSAATKQSGRAPVGSVPRAEPTHGGGQYHVVAAGENLFRIATTYGVDYRDLASENGIADPEHIEVGQRIFIPGATRVR